MQRVVIVGRGGAGKSTLAERLGAITRLPVIELDQHFWQPGLVPSSPGRWRAIQRELIAQRPAWILDGDLGSHDVLDVRLAAADTIVVMDYSLVRCVWRSLRRSRERADFWFWVLHYRCRNRPLVLEQIARSAPHADAYVLRNPRATRRFIERVAEKGQRAQPAPSPRV